MTTQHIGAAGELLVQYRLLKVGIDSARLTTDAGIDLVVYAPGSAEATTVQVKSNLSARPAGGKGQLSRGWDFPHTCPAQLLALVALDVDRVWLFTLAEARELAQQHSPKGVRKLYWFVEPPAGGAGGARHEAEMAQYLLEDRAEQLFPH
ncbi:hypothetical protein [Nocardioides ungokensis]|uniref:hypothetical protein n=1 Tax=Nocardioides ungokensis TaxID=1643322 RepID=UPI0015DDDD8B|nr:hypothetical protein [Nocardioides ungokensis]